VLLRKRGESPLVISYRTLPCVGVTALARWRRSCQLDPGAGELLMSSSIAEGVRSDKARLA